MQLSRLSLSASCVFVAALLVSSCAAQSARQETQTRVKKIPPPVTTISTPFELNAPPSERTKSIAFRPEDSMTAQDRQAVAGATPVIRKDAALAGFDLDKGRWTYKQIVCPVFPQPILLFFSRNNGVGDVSEFSAILPQNGKGAVRIVPILRRSYALFPPAPVNPLTISAFNWIGAQEHSHKKVDWLTTGLCYAALTGTRVVLPQQAGNHTEAGVPLAMGPLLQVGADGSAVVRFDDVGAPQRPKEWDLTFDNQGKLLQVAVTPVPALQVKPLP
jgi:hypothetical protein